LGSYAKGANLILRLEADSLTNISSLTIQLGKGLPSVSDIILTGAKIWYNNANLVAITLWEQKSLHQSFNMSSYSIGLSGVNLQPNSQDKPNAHFIHALLHHLNNNLEYYYRAIWMNMDESRRYLILDKIKSPQIIGDPTAVVSVAQVVENVVYGVVGNSLVMPVARGIQLDPTYTLTEEANLNDLYRPKESVLRMSVAIPTPGVFAESIMGACNACEKIDKSRMQDWTFATTDEPTSINPLDTSSRYQNHGNLQAKDLPNPIVNIQNAPNAPEPQGFSALSSILGKSDLFKDMTGLEGNQKLLVDALLSDAQNSRYGMQVTAGLVAMAMDKENSQKRLSDLQDKRDKIAGNRNLSPSERAAQLAAVDNEMENEKSKSISLSDYLPQSGSMDSLLKDPLARAGIKSVTQNADGSFKIEMQEGNEGASEESEEDEITADKISSRIIDAVIAELRSWGTPANDTRTANLLSLGQFASISKLIASLKKKRLLPYGKFYSIGQTQTPPAYLIAHSRTLFDNSRTNYIAPTSGVLAYAATVGGSIYICERIWTLVEQIIKTEDDYPRGYGIFSDTLLGYYNYTETGARGTANRSGLGASTWQFICQVVIHELIHWGNNVNGIHSVANWQARNSSFPDELGNTWETLAYPNRTVTVPIGSPTGTTIPAAPISWTDLDVSPIIYAWFAYPLTGLVGDPNRGGAGIIYDFELRNLIRQRWPNVFYSNNTPETI
jgi:hypothetical protein